MSKVDTDFFPINKLYYEMLVYLKQKINRREWESPAYSKADEDEMSEDHIKYEDKCLNPFCLRPKFQMDDASDVFCSKICKDRYE